MFKDKENNEIVEHLVAVNRVAKVVKGGRRFGFAAIVVAGDSQGKVGYGTRKAKEVPNAIKKGCEDQQQGITTFIEVILNQELGEPFRRDAMKAPVAIAGISKGDMKAVG